MPGPHDADARTLARAGTLVAGRYRLERSLGQGGMGAVYAAYDTSLHRQIALKRMASGHTSARTANLSFMREYHLLAQLRHPRIIEAYEYGVDEGVPYYTMELLVGADLSELAPLAPALVCRYLRDVASSLALLHVRRMLHRDLSPRNVRRLVDGRCKLLDFGTAVPFGKPPNIAGTPPFIPPEALRDTALGPRSDLYSLGALGYFLLTGKCAYSAATIEQLSLAHLQESVVRPSKLVSVDEALEALLLSLLSLDPGRRPESAADVIESLNAAGQLPPDDLPGVASSYIASSRLIGQVHQLAQVERRGAAALANKGGAVLIYGDDGSGRTRFLSEVARSAQLRGFATVESAARGGRGTETLTASLLHALERALPELVAPLMRTRLPNGLADQQLGSTAKRAPDIEARAGLQATLMRLFCEVARQKPLLIAIDDLELADDFSVALVAALAHEAPDLPLLIVATRRREGGEATFSAMEMLRKAASSVHLLQLSRGQTAELALSMFGDVPNLERVADWLYRAAHGNPGLSVELAQHLIARRIVRYLEGTWALPSDPITEPVPSGLVQVIELRVSRLTALARSLAELMSVRRGGVTLPLAAAAMHAATDQILDALGELVGDGIVELEGEQYVFAQQAMRELIARGLTQERSAALHAALAQALLASADSFANVQLEAAWHLVHTKDELRGAEQLAQIAPALLRGGLHTTEAIAALARAHDVFERHSYPLDVRLRLRTELVSAGYYFDYRLGLQYGEQTLLELFRTSGLALKQRIVRFVPRAIAAALSFAITAFRRYFLPKKARGPHPIVSLMLFGRASLALMGLRATALDGPGTAKILAMVDLLDNGLFPPLDPRAAYLSARAFALQTLGREAELNEAVALALGALRERRNPFISERDWRGLLIGLLLVDGVNESYRERSRALKRAEELDALDTHLARACAHRVRMIHYQVRGARDAADLERRALDLIAIQGGTTWQVEWFAAPIEGLTSAVFADLLGVRRALDKLNVLLQHVPSLEPMRDAVQLSYHFQRGELARVIELGEDFLAKHPPRTAIGWGPTYSMIIDAMASMGRAEQAVEIAERALSTLSQADFEYFVMYAPLQAALAWALACVGDFEAAMQQISALTARFAYANEHSWLALMHSHRARIAARAGDREALQASVRELRLAALSSNNPPLVVLARRWELSHDRALPSPPPLAAGSTQPPAQLLDDGTAPITDYLRAGTQDERYARALEVLTRACGATDSHLFVLRSTGIRRVASLSAALPPVALGEQIAVLLHTQPLPSICRLQLPANSNGAGPAEEQSYRVLLLPATSTEHMEAVAVLEGAEALLELQTEVLFEVSDALG